jgi:hypothetical protein
VETIVLLVDLTALLVSFIALGVALYGIKDVREQVHLLTILERNRVYTRLLHNRVWQFVDRTVKADKAEAAALMQEYIELARTVDSSRTLDYYQGEANRLILSYGKELVDSGYAAWKPEMDADKASKLLRAWQADVKLGENIANIFGKK